MLILYYKMLLGLDGYIAILEKAVNGLTMIPIDWKVRQQERKPSTVIAIDLSDRTGTIRVMKVLWKLNTGSSTESFLCHTRSTAFEISKENSLLSL